MPLHTHTPYAQHTHQSEDRRSSDRKYTQAVRRTAHADAVRRGEALGPAGRVQARPLVLCHTSSTHSRHDHNTIDVVEAPVL